MKEARNSKKMARLQAGHMQSVHLMVVQTLERVCIECRSMQEDAIVGNG